MTTGQGEDGSAPTSPRLPSDPRTDQRPEVAVAKINRSSAIIAAAVTGTITLIGGIITAIVTYNAGLQHSSAPAETGAIAMAPAQAQIATAHSSTQPTQASATSTQRPSNSSGLNYQPVSLLGMTPIESFGGSEFKVGPEKVNTVPYAQTLYQDGGTCYYNSTTYELDRKYHYFEATVGIDDRSDSAANVTFKVYVGDQANQLATPSPTVSLGQTVAIKIDVSGSLRMMLFTNCNTPWGGAVWINPVLVP